jgi:hypothetical protein
LRAFSRGVHRAACRSPGRGLNETIHIIGVDDERFAQLLRCPCKRTQYEYAVFIVSCCHEFLRHQIHAIVQRADDAEVREAV